MNVKNNNNRGKPATLLFCVCSLLIPLLLPACAVTDAIQEHTLNAMGGNKRTIDVHMPVVYIQPSIHEWNRSVGLFLLRDAGNSKMLSYDLTTKLHQKLLQKQLFHTVSVIKLLVGSNELAIEKGRELGFDYVITGEITSYLAPASIAIPPQVSIRLRIIECKTGNTLWYIEDSATADAPEIKKELGLATVDDFPKTSYIADIVLNTMVKHLEDFKRKGEHRS